MPLSTKTKTHNQPRTITETGRWIRAQHNAPFDEQYEIPTLQELLDLRKRLSIELGREIGVYPETKHPTYFQNIGMSLEWPLVDILQRNGLNNPDASVFVQSFEVTNLGQLRDLGLRTAAVQLLSATGAPYDTVAAGKDHPSYADLATPAGLRGIAAYAQGIGPDKVQVIPRAANGRLAEATTLVADAHSAGLTVHPYAFRAENTFLPVDYRRGPLPSDFGRAIDEQLTYLQSGIDGLFTDQADIGVLARADFLAATPVRGK